jgi:hypothetical protein
MLRLARRLRSLIQRFRFDQQVAIQIRAKELAEPLRPPELGPMPTEEWLFSLLPMNEKPPGVKPSGCRLR